MAILSVVGVKMFNSAMNSHRANELIYEANKRATMVAAQIMAGRAMDQLSVAEFTDSVGYTFGVESNPLNTNQFNITLFDVDSNVCSKIKQTVDDGSIIRKVNTTCTTFTFNNDLSKTAYASEHDTDKTSCDNKGYKWCTNGNNGVSTKCVPNNSDCCANVEYDLQCQSCNPDTGEVSDKSGSCSINVFNTQTQSYEQQLSTCQSGVCPNPNITTDTSCTTNEQCGGQNSGWYCVIMYNATNNRNQTQSVANGDCYHDLVGKCRVLPSASRLSLSGKAILSRAFGSKFVVGPALNWWSAKNWCEAKGKQMLDAIELDCYNGNTPTKSSRCCKKGESCLTGNWDTVLWNGNKIKDGKAAEVAKFSDKFVALRKVYGGGTFHTSTPYASNSDNSCNNMVVYTVRGDIYGGNGRQVEFRPLCH